ncbi:hypothetical protein CF336_g323 [Tilletia laevis]|nr:hypothetical protein CF336_g323 [Tilletia laevis]
MKFSLFSILIVAAVVPVMVSAMSCPDGTSPGTDYCQSCGCYCGSDRRVHCDENTVCYSTSGSAQVQLLLRQ